MNQTVRQGGGSTVRGAALALLLTVYPSTRLASQQPDTARPAPPIITTGATVVPTDTTHRMHPMGAFLRSFLLPGWGQAATGRRVTGALFATWEGVTAMMTLKAQSEYHYLKETNWPTLGAKRQEVQDWLVLWIFNHFFSGAEAFVSAHLQDFPKDLKIRAFPDGAGGRGGGLGVGVSLPLSR